MKQLTLGFLFILGSFALTVAVRGGPMPYGNTIQTILIGCGIVLFGGIAMFLLLYALITVCVPPSIKQERKDARANGHKTMFR